ncbi:hypothetical protein ACFLWZ_07440 [Chloroflexota bacterium]
MATKSSITKFLNHLNYLGYNIKDRHNGVYLAKHEWMLDLLFENKSTGILFYSWVNGNEIAKIDRAGFIECINHLNAKAMVLRFYTDKENDLVMDAWYPKPYDRLGFVAFMDLLTRDFELLFCEEHGVKTYYG